MSALTIGLSLTIMINKIPAYFKTCYFHSVHNVLTQPGRWHSVKKEKKKNKTQQQFNLCIRVLASGK
jgi:hypothetical protein